MNQPSSSNLTEIRASVTTLTDLILMLHPVVPRQILTTYDIESEYHAAELTDTIQRALDSSRRILNQNGDHQLKGLCDFHLGLIYLHWGHCHAAGRYFAEARHHWEFTDENAGLCLTYFAEGRANEHARQYETAMGKYTKAEQWLPRIHIPAIQTQNGFLGLLQTEMKRSQMLLREILWFPPRAQPQTGQRQAPSRPQPPPNRPRQEQQAADFVADEPITGTGDRGGIPQPIINFDPSIPPQTPRVPSPVAGHEQTNPAYVWYKVEAKPDEAFLPKITTDTWVLVQPRASWHQYEADQLLVVLKPGIDRAGIVLQRFGEEQRPFSRIYLARSQFVGRFSRDTETGAVQLSSQQRLISVYPPEIVGLVIGLWQVMSTV